MLLLAAIAALAICALPVPAATMDGDVASVEGMPPSAGAITESGASLSPPGSAPRVLGEGPVITAVSPQIASAGTNTEITITGSGFGTKASQASNADVGFTSYNAVYWASGRTNPSYNVYDIVSWSDTEVRVRVPTGYSSEGYFISASSGSVWVVTDANQTSNRVPFAVSFGVTKDKWATAPVFLVNDNCPNVTGGADAVRRAAATWNAALPASFQIDCSGTSTSTRHGNDGVNLIAWGSPPRSGYWYSGTTIFESDIILDSSIPWTTAVAGGSVRSIESWILHEMGFNIGIAFLGGTDPQGPWDIGKAMAQYRSDRYGNMNPVSLHPADRAAVDYLYNGGSANPPLLAAAFTADTITGSAPLTVQFADATIGGATGWAWEFGDGGTSTERNPTHIYSAPGNYTVTLTSSAPGFPSDTIRAIDRITVNASALPLLAVPPSTLPPTDPNADGFYDDVNGNGRPDFADVVLYFNQMSWIATNEPTALFDYNANGRIDFADVVWLFNSL